MRRLGRRPVVLGVDAGGTKTDAIVCDTHGAVLGFGRAGSGNWENVGLDGMQSALDVALEAALVAAGSNRSRVVAACFGLAGLDWASDEAPLDAAIAELDVDGERTLCNDAFLALRAGCRATHGIASNCGTGTIVCGRNRAGESFRTMAIGFGEPGGAVELVTGALDAVAAAYHGSAPETALRDALVGAAGLGSVLELFEALSRERLTLGGELAPLVLRTADTGDAVARTLVERLGRELGATVGGVAGRLQMCDDTFELVRFGGVHTAGNALLDSAFAAAVHAGCPGAGIVPLAAPPVVGAALYALEALGAVDGALHERLAADAARAARS